MSCAEAVLTLLELAEEQRALDVLAWLPISEYGVYSSGRVIKLFLDKKIIVAVPLWEVIQLRIL